MKKLVDFLAVKINCDPDFRDILIAELSFLNYDSMMETDEGLEAYIKAGDFDEKALEGLKSQYVTANITYQLEEVAERNWNEEWENNYAPISVEDKVLVRATFHKSESDYPYEIVINPRMSFGTGHHATTYLMLKNQLEIDHAGKRVLDAGCGTAILAIMAEKRGATDIIAYDNNTWSTENAPENISLNHCEHVQVMEGTIDSLDLSGTFDIILANINKNVLLQEMPSYVNYLSQEGIIVFSGFYEKDEHELIKKARNLGLSQQNKELKDGWSSLVFIKSK
ncbi:MAG: 50S ribosomal protein L11 methyltransferase [Fulvivirga sp.]|nr:50S ribosomal protein L11 methyltransferase [Fulvivirga sp.]